jgi:uncharacterized protein YhjY with autotransporter beta-barrel domain
VQVPATTVLCSGNQSGGVAVGRTPLAGGGILQSPPVTTIDVRSLSGAIGPAGGERGIFLHNEAGNAVAVHAGTTTAPISIEVRGDSAGGIVVNGFGTPTLTREFFGWYLPSGSGGNGGNVTVDSFGAITTDGNDAPGISARSRAGGYSAAVVATLQSLRGSGQSDSFSVDTVQGSADKVNTAVTGSNGGAFRLFGLGLYTYDLAGVPLDALAPGAHIDTSVQFTVASANGHAPSEATLTLRITRLQDGTLTVQPATYFAVYGRAEEGAATAYTPGTGTRFGLITLRPDFDAYMTRLLSDSAVGGTGGDVVVTASGSIATRRDASLGQGSYGILAQSKGGTGLAGGGGVFSGDAGQAGAAGGAVTVINSATIHTHGEGAHGIVASSAGGDGGRGGGASFAGSGGSGGAGAKGGRVEVLNSGDITTERQGAYGIFAQSVGGRGGQGGGGGWLGGGGGAGGAGTVNDKVFVSNSGAILTRGDDSHGVFAQNIGGFGGSGGGASGIVALGSSGGNAGAGGEVEVVNTGRVEANGRDANALFAQSIGGGGGSAGGAGGLIALGGDGNAGGNGGLARVTNSGALLATGAGGRGILAQSIGGGGGHGGGAGGVVAIGGDGATTSDGGTVSVGNGGAITAKSNAIFAESVGGGGGVGGSSGGWFSIGGSGGGGGAGGAVSVANSGNLSTAEGNSAALFAQSVGGGGGHGGNAVAVGAFASVAIGGKGGPGGAGAGVTVTSTAGTIETQGTESHGIYAQSLGGGGGSGGFAAAVAGGGGLSGALAVGRQGGGGGIGGPVQLDSSSDITTHGGDAHGLYAQSVGGGGGTGGFAVAASGAVEGVAISVAIGGGGGAAGDGGAVTVGKDAPVTGQIHTEGNAAHGIVAQSIGGGGGRGGLAIAANINVGSEGSGGVSFSLGGGGGAGGKGGAVTVNSAATITTGLERAYGIKAQSVGGGGGDGGLAVAGALGGPGSANFGFAVGGAGGPGSAGGTVDVNLTGGSIDTSGKDAHGVFAQSVGGGGGTGGMAIAASVGLGSDHVNVSFSVGGVGGDGGIGERVTVTNAGAIATRGDAAFGVFAQSVGGGGGTGGASFSGEASLVAGQEGSNFNAGFAFGGAGGTGNRGGKVDVTNAGRIETWGAAAHGIFAESVGGGGGQGGSARTMSIALSGVDVSAKKYGAFNLSLGGRGGDGGDGGDVNIASSGTIVTHGVDAHGLYAQSVGGGGGTGGEGAHGFFGVPTIGIDRTPIWQQFSISLGGDAGAAGDGKDVVVRHTGSITTESAGAWGIFAQSVGGGGGTGGVGAIGFTGTVGIGGTGGASGDGGAVDVAVNGTIETRGASAYGVFAQSVGGGGGVAGDITRGWKQVMNFGIGVGVVGNSQNGGDGGRVRVTGTGAIHTVGEGASAIFAQSVGGGGGVAGDIGNWLIPPLGDRGAEWSGATGSAGGNGSGGTISVDWTGRITTEGRRAHGIFAQSAGGEAFDVVVYDSDGKPTGKTLARRQNIGQDVQVIVRGDVSAQGPEAHGIFAHSEGFMGNGDIDVQVLGGTVKGGTGAEAAGVKLQGGKNNRIYNTGTIGAADGIRGIAISADNGLDLNPLVFLKGNDFVDNRGTVNGSVLLGPGRNAFMNASGARFEMGPTVALGTGNLLTNRGTLAPGGTRAAGITTLTGELAQPGGTLAIDIDRRARAADRLDVSGTATLGGQVALYEVNAGAARPGILSHTILRAAGGAQDAGLGLVARPSVVNTYQLAFPNANEVQVTVVTDFRSPLYSDALNRNQRAIAENINAVQLAGGSDAIAPLVAGLMEVPEIAGLKAAYERLSPEPYANELAETMNSSMRFSQAMLSCRVRDGEYRFVQEGECYWFRALGRQTRRARTDENLGFDDDAGEISGGVQKAINRNWFAGFAGSYEWTTLKTDDDAKSDGQRGQLGAMLKAVYGGATASLGVSAGAGTYDTRRTLSPLLSGVVASGTQHLTFAATHLRLGYAFEQPSWYVRPVVDLGATWVRLDGFQESGAGGAGLDVQAQTETYTSIQPAVEFGGELALANGVLVRPFALLGATHYFSGTNPRITARFQGAPAGVAPFTVTGEMDENYFDAAAGVDLLSKDGKDLRLVYTGQFGSNTQTNAIALKLSIPF